MTRRSEGEGGSDGSDPKAIARELQRYSGEVHSGTGCRKGAVRRQPERKPSVPNDVRAAALEGLAPMQLNLRGVGMDPGSCELGDAGCESGSGAAMWSGLLSFQRARGSM